MINTLTVLGVLFINTVAQCVCLLDCVTPTIQFAMIQKRYQYRSKEGVVWTEWQDFVDDDTMLLRLQKEEQWQLKPLKNEYRIV